MKNREKLLEEMAARARRCRKCRLATTRNLVVFGEGPVTASAMLIGEAPGEAEDECGRPFVGRTGRFFDEQLSAAGLSRQDLYITSTVKCRPPKNRNPKKDEGDTCTNAWLDRQIELIDPAFLLVMGKIAHRQLCGDDASITEVHGRFFPCRGRSCLTTCHPTAAMRFPKMRRFFTEDLQTFAEALHSGKR